MILQEITYFPFIFLLPLFCFFVFSVISGSSFKSNPAYSFLSLFQILLFLSKTFFFFTFHLSPPITLFTLSCHFLFAFIIFYLSFTLPFQFFTSSVFIILSLTLYIFIFLFFPSYLFYSSCFLLFATLSLSLCFFLPFFLNVISLLLFIFYFVSLFPSIF